MQHARFAHNIHLTNSGSDRATGYNMSSKLVRRDGQLFAGWLDAPAAPGGSARIQLGVCNGQTGTLEATIQLAEGVDNHCGPALALDGQGRLHVLTGAHHGPFLYRWSDDPANPASWSEPEPVGALHTYPALAVDAAGTLHLAYRERGEHWQLQYRRKRPDRDWEAPVSLAISPTPGYNHFMQSLTIGPAGAVHICFQYHYAESGNASDCTGRYAVHLRSDDGGDTWHNEGRLCRDLPLTIDSIRPVLHYPDGGLRVASHVVDGNDSPWWLVMPPDAPAGLLLHGRDDSWDHLPLDAAFPGLNFQGFGSRSSAISREANGRIHLAVASHPGGAQTDWFDPSHELFYGTVTEDGVMGPHGQITRTDPSAAQWLPALEQWDWTRSHECCDGGPWLMYTRGLNQGGIGGNNANTLHADVYLGRAFV